MVQCGEELNANTIHRDSIRMAIANHVVSTAQISEIMILGLGLSAGNHLLALITVVLRLQAHDVSLVRFLLLLTIFNHVYISSCVRWGPQLELISCSITFCDEILWWDSFIQIMVICMCDINLGNNIFQSVFTHKTPAYLQASRCTTTTLDHL